MHTLFFSFHLCFTCFHLPIVIFFPFIHLPLAPRLGPPLHFNRPCSTQPTRVSWSCLHLPSRALFQERWISRRFFSSPVKDCTLVATCVGDLSVIRFFICVSSLHGTVPRVYTSCILISVVVYTLDGFRISSVRWWYRCLIFLIPLMPDVLG